MVLNPQSPKPPANRAQGLEANYVFVHESQAVLAEETHGQCACSKRVSSWAGTASQCPGELSAQLMEFLHQCQTPGCAPSQNRAWAE